MSVTKDKTLAKVRTFAQDFNEHQPTPEQVINQNTSSPKIDEGVSKENEVKPVPKIVVTKKPEKREETEIPKITVVSSPAKTEPIPKEESTVKKVPAFHELQKNFDRDVSANKDAFPSSTKSIKVKKRNTVTKRRPNFGADAMVITANKQSAKKSDVSFFSGLGIWFTSLLKSFSKKETPKYTVQDSVRRKGVIEKATTKSGAIFTSDNDTLREQILRRREQELHESDVTWSPYTDAGYELLEAPKTEGSGVQVTYKKRNLPEPEITEPVSTGWGFYNEEVTPAPIPEPIPEPVYEPEPIVIEPEPIPEPVLPITLPPQPVTVTEPEPIIEAVADSAPVVPKAIQSESRGSLLAKLRELLNSESRGELNTNAVALAAVIGVVSVVLIVFVTKTLFGIFFIDNPGATITTATPLIPGTLVIDVPLQEISDTSLRAQINQSDALVGSSEQEIRFITMDNEVLSPQLITDLLQLRINPNLEQTITNLHILVVDNIQHALVFSVNDPVTALGGMLEWESNMEQDLKTILNTKTTPTDSKRFVDEAFGSLDARVLTDGEDDILVYGFLDENTILITKTTDTFVRMTQ